MVLQVWVCSVEGFGSLLGYFSLSAIVLSLENGVFKTSVKAEIKEYVFSSMGTGSPCEHGEAVAHDPTIPILPSEAKPGTELFC